MRSQDRTAAPQTACASFAMRALFASGPSLWQLSIAKTVAYIEAKTEKKLFWFEVGFEAECRKSGENDRIYLKEVQIKTAT